jgi:hypothetical protein
MTIDGKTVLVTGGGEFEVEVDPADALAAFRHPYAYTHHEHGAHALAA